MRVLIVGGVAAGPKTASRIVRLQPHAEVTILEKGHYLSYAGCGLPYYIADVVGEAKELMCTGIGVVRDPVFFQKVKNVRVLTQTEALEVDRGAKRVRTRNLQTGEDVSLDYDKLVLATGAVPVRPPIAGTGLKNVFTLHNVDDAQAIKAALAAGKARQVVITGGGLIGMEAAEALVACGCDVTIVEMLDQTLSLLDGQMARLVERHVSSKGATVMTGVKVQALEGKEGVTKVVTEKGALAADMVLLAVGVRPNVALARGAGLEVGPTGAIQVDAHMRTSDPDIYAAGDCAECTHMLTGRPCYVPLGSTANKQGRVAAANVCGREETFPGVLGSMVCKVFDFCIGRTGLTETEACEAGYDAVSALVPGPDRAHYMPDARSLILKLVADRSTRRLLGLQAVGTGAGDKRIDVAAMALTAGMTVDQLANADLCYAPPYSPALDNIITAANVVRNKLDGLMVGISARDVHGMMEQKQEFVLLDVRSQREYEQVRLGGSTLIPLGALRERLSELPKEKPIVTFCRASLRGYEAARILTAAGFKDVRVMDGGLATWPYETEP